MLAQRGFRELAPVYLASPGNILASCCHDGIAIRFERRVDESRMIVAWADTSLAEFVPKLSQNLIRLIDGSFTNTVEGGILVTMTVQRKEATAAEPMLSFRVAFDAVVERPDQLPAQPHKPYCLLSVRNELDIELQLESADNGPIGAAPERLIVRNTVRMPIGWDCIEVYPFFQVEQWKPEYASVWAETDILAAVVAAQFKEQRYNSLDPNADARQRSARLLESYKALLDSNPDREEQLQRFLSAHPALLCPAHVKMWPKAPLGNRVTDFVFQEAAGDYLLVELERSTHRLFLQDPSVPT